MKKDIDKPCPYCNRLIAGPDVVEIYKPNAMEVRIKSDGKVVWIHVDGVARFRACKIGNLVLTYYK